ncbi:MAG TPA: GTP-binding protein [Alicyclobacillus sp.]|nr:GTP-binding protein [Alicyclobacillus sp.]
MATDTRIPVIILTGFLGSGKTTILAHVMELIDPARTEIIINEYGSVGLDQYLIQQVKEETQVLKGGCVCCQLRSDLVTVLQQVANRIDSGERIDRVIIETSGLADPAPIMFTIYTDPMLQNRFRIGGVITTVDATTTHSHLPPHPEWIKQITSADWVIITKKDIADQHDAAMLARQISSMNPSAAIYTAKNGHVNHEKEFLKDLLSLNSRGNLVWQKDLTSSTADHHDSKETTASLSLRFAGTVNWSAFSVWLSMLLHAHGEHILRIKGLLDVGSPGPIVLNGVQHIVHPPIHLSEWPDEDTVSRLVIIVRGIDPDRILDSLHIFGRFIGATLVKV